MSFTTEYGSFHLSRYRLLSSWVLLVILPLWYHLYHLIFWFDLWNLHEVPSRISFDKWVYYSLLNLFPCTHSVFTSYWRVTFGLEYHLPRQCLYRKSHHYPYYSMSSFSPVHHREVDIVVPYVLKVLLTVPTSSSVSQEWTSLDTSVNYLGSGGPRSVHSSTVPVRVKYFVSLSPSLLVLRLSLTRSLLRTRERVKDLDSVKSLGLKDSLLGRSSIFHVSDY